MKRASSAEWAPRKRHCRASSYNSALEISHDRERPQHASASTPPLPSRSDLAHSLDACQEAAHAQCTDHARFIANWINDASSSCTRSEFWDSSRADDAQVPQTMSDNSRLRGLKRRARSCSPTKKGSQYRNTVLKPANILVDVIHDLPSDIEALLPNGLRDILDPPPAPPSAAHTDAETPSTTYKDNTESNSWERELTDKVSQLAAVYRDECRELAGKPGSEPEYRTHLYSDIVEKLARILPWRRILSANCSDKLWCVSLKPPASTPLISLPWPTLSASIMPAKPQETLSFESSQHNSLDSDIVRVRPSESPFNLAFSPLPTEPSESSAASELDDTITTPKPDITVGISREAFSPAQAGLLEFWQARKAVYSDPHATQGDMRFPFFFIEAKGLVTNGNLIGAQNQAAGGGTCAIRLLDSLAKQDPGLSAPRIIFSLTTEGAMHELWVHYQLVDEDKNAKHHMTCLGAWRTTLERHANEFVAALAIILRWGVEVFHPQIKQLLDRVLEAATLAESI